MLFSILRSGRADLLQVIMYILSTLLTIFFVLPLHECAHAFVAYKLGDSTAKWRGRLTLNPMKHIDYFGAALLLIAGFGWAKPVPINARNFKDPKVGMALSALAGPVSNLLAAILAGLLQNCFLMLMAVNVLPYGNWAVYVLFFFKYLIYINVGLAVFNFLPVPPLDGSKILMAFLPDKAIFWISQREQMISMGLMILVVMGAFNGILTVADAFLYDLIIWLTALPFAWAF